jgi:predicted nucleotidyltransferase
MAERLDVGHFKSVLANVLTACRQHYGRRLVSVAVFGSVGRGTPRPDSDVDLLIVAEDLPPGRVARIADFRAVEDAVVLALVEIGAGEVRPFLSPVFKTPAEVEHGSPLFLDMTEDVQYLHDRDDFLRRALDKLRTRLERLGARRIWRGSAWYWDLKPDYRPGEIFDL